MGYCADLARNVILENKGANSRRRNAARGLVRAVSYKGGLSSSDADIDNHSQYHI